MENNIKAIIFDLDGTLLNTLDDLADSVNTVLKRRGLTIFPVEKYKYLVGNGMEMLAERVLPSELKNDEYINDFVIDVRAEYNKLWKNKTRIYDGIPDLLHILLNNGIKISILSNKPHNFTKLTVNEYFKNYKFEVIQGAVDNIPKKPDPTQAINIANKMKIPVENISFVGDTLIDMQTACAAGMYPIGVTWGFRDRTELIENGAKAIVNKPMEILEILNNTNK